MIVGCKKTKEKHVFRYRCFANEISTTKKLRIGVNTQKSTIKSTMETDTCVESRKSISIRQKLTTNLIRNPQPSKSPNTSESGILTGQIEIFGNIGVHFD